MVINLEIYVGTSGWLYDWNKGHSLDWYVKYSGLNAVELNSSFYRLPRPSMVNSWVSKASTLRWSIKAYRYISHVAKLSGNAMEWWRKMIELFRPLDGSIDFYLIQLPPSFKYSNDNLAKLRSFISEIGGRRIAVEFRERGWFNDTVVNSINELGATVVSIDSPEIRWIGSSNDVVYLRMHGRSNWYFHNYSSGELLEVAKVIESLNPIKVYVFFNNNHWMLENARTMLNILSGRY